MEKQNEILDKSEKITIIKRIKNINKETIAIILILIIGFSVRLFQIDKMPNALNVDEASAGYEAYSILHYGIDRNGNFMPVFLKAWGSGQNVLLTYLMIPFIQILGLGELAIRLPMAIVGCISLIIFYKLLKKTTNKKIAIIGMAFLAICPWHILKSRWALESNLLPDIILWAVYLFVLSIEKKKTLYYYTSFAVAGLAAYAYGTSYFFLPCFLIPLVIVGVKKKWITVKQAILGVAITGIISLPIILYVIINTLNLPQINLPFMTIPRLEVNRYQEITSIFSSEFIRQSIENFKQSICCIFIKQYDELPWNAIKPYGIIYSFSIIFTIIGLVELFRKKKTLEIKYQAIWKIWFIVSIIMTIVCEPNINRLNIMMFPIIFMTVIGIQKVICNKKEIGIAFAILYGILFTCFLIDYSMQDCNTYWTFESNLEEPMKELKELETDHQIYITNDIKESYIYTLFYTKYDTREFVKTVKYERPDVAFRGVLGFGNYHFQEIKEEEIEGKKENVYLVKNGSIDINKLDTEKFNIKEFEGFTLIEGKE